MNVGEPTSNSDSEPLAWRLNDFLNERQAAEDANYRRGVFIAVGALFASLLVPWYFDQALILACLAGFSALVCLVLCRYWYLAHCRQFDKFQGGVGLLSQLGLDFFGAEKRKLKNIDLGDSARTFHRLKKNAVEFSWILFAISVLFFVISVASFSAQQGTVENPACPGWDCGGEPARPAAKGLIESIELLRADIAQLARTIADKPRNAEPTVPGGPVPIDLTLTFPAWVVTVFVMISVICIGLAGYLFLRRKPSPGKASVLLALAVSSAFGAKLAINLNGKIELKSLFSCEQCLTASITKNTTLAGGGLRQFGKSPIFDVGTAEVGEKTTRCVAIQPKEFEWADWLNVMKRDWLKRANPSESDVLLVVGAADRQHLRGELQDQFDSNVGLAKARAESVKALLIELINAEAIESLHKLNDQRVIALSDGPKNTSKLEKRSKSKNGLCSPLFAEDRRVTLFVSGSPLK